MRDGAGRTEWDENSDISGRRSLYVVGWGPGGATGGRLDFTGRPRQGPHVGMRCEPVVRYGRLAWRAQRSCNRKTKDRQTQSRPGQTRTSAHRIAGRVRADAERTE